MPPLLSQVAVLAAVLALASCGSADSVDAPQTGSSTGSPAKLSEADNAQIQSGIEGGSVPDRGSQRRPVPLKPTALKFNCQGHGVVVFEATLLPTFAGGGLVYFRDEQQWAATGNHTLTGAELCRGDQQADGISAAEIDKRRQQLTTGIDLVDRPATVLEDVVFSGTRTGTSGSSRLDFVGYDPKIGIMGSASYVPSLDKWVRF
jgi:hypothetical protein